MKKRDAPQNLGGRPPALTPDSKTLDFIRGLGEIQCTTREAACALRVSEPTFMRFINMHPEARDAFEQGQGVGRISLRRSQFRLAERNAAMGIWLGKQFLDQRDPSAAPRHEDPYEVAAAIRAVMAATDGSNDIGRPGSEDVEEQFGRHAAIEP